MRLWMRQEADPDERRAPIVPADAGRLVAAGALVTVERSAHRVFPAEEYAAAGCALAAADGWASAPADATIVGIKEPGPDPRALCHRHVFFGHAYKGQRESGRVIGRFAAGGGTLLDLEYLTDDAGRRVVAFGYWAGYAGAALAVLHARGRLAVPLRPYERAELDAALEAAAGSLRALVVGALGRSGTGARAALAAAGADITGWDVAETRVLDRAALLGHDLLVNTVLSTVPAPPLLRPDDVTRPDRRLSVVSDVTVDVTSDLNLLPIYDRATDWAEPVRRLAADPVLDLIAIDNLPSLLPREASVAFSADLLPHLAGLDAWSPVWQRALEAFRAAATTDPSARENPDA